MPDKYKALIKSYILFIGKRRNSPGELQICRGGKKQSVTYLLQFRLCPFYVPSVNYQDRIFALKDLVFEFYGNFPLFLWHQ